MIAATSRNADKRMVRNAALCGSAALFAGIGLARFGYAPFVPALVEARWFTPSQADYLGAANLVGYVFGAAAARRLATLASTASLLRTAMSAVTLHFLACGWPEGFLWFLFWRLVVGVAGGILMVLAAPAVVARTPAALRGAVGGVVFTGVGLGTALSGSVIPKLVAMGLPVAWRTLSGIVFLLTAACWREFGQWSTQEPSTEEAPNRLLNRSCPPERSQRYRPGLPVATVTLLIAAYCANAIGFVPHTIFWVDFIARGLSLGLETGGRYWVLLGLSAACGPLLTGLLADRIGFGRSLRWSLLAKAIGVALPLISTKPWALALSSIGTGSMAIGVVSVASGRVTELVPLSRQQQVWGWMTASFSVAYAGSAYLFSLLFSRTESFRLLFATGAGALLAGCLLDLISSVHGSAKRVAPDTGQAR